MAEWIKEWWTIVVFILTQGVLFLRAFERLSNRVNNLDEKLDKHLKEADPMMRAFAGMPQAIQDLIRRLDEIEERAVRERAEQMLAMQSGLTELGTRLSTLDARIFNIATKGPKSAS